MTITLLVTLSLSELSAEAVLNIANDLHDDLLEAGHDVVEVKPWQRPSLGLTPGAVGPALAQPIPQPQHPFITPPTPPPNIFQ